MSIGFLPALLLLGQQGQGPFAFEHFHGVLEVEGAFATLTQRHPRYFRVGSLGTSVRGRSIPFLEVTDHESSGPKRAFWVDGGNHGNELAGAEIVLGFAEELRRRIALDEPPGFLGELEVYLVPALNVDARELCIVPPFPGLRANLQPVDDDGDGRADEDGPVDLNGDDYASLQESRDQDGDGRCGEDPLGGVDLNRDFPVHRVERAAGWCPQPETLAVLHFWEAHPNLALAVSYHGGSVVSMTSELFVWPPVALADGDVARFEAVLGIYRRLCTGSEWNPAREPDKYGSHSPLVGTAMEWFYAERKALAFTLEVEPGFRDAWTAGPKESVAQECADFVRVPRVSLETRQRSITSTLAPLAARHATFLLALAEHLSEE